MKRSFISSALASMLVFTSTYSSAIASEDQEKKSRQDIRFYKMNRDEGVQKIRFTKRKARQPGCHNFIKKIRLHKTVQFSYQQCQVFSKKNCKADSVMAFHTEKDPETHITQLQQGYGWLPVGDHKRGEKVKSWFCE